MRVLANHSAVKAKPNRNFSKLKGYGQSPQPLTEDIEFERMKNLQKDELINIKKNLETKLKNIVSESKKP